MLQSTQELAKTTDRVCAEGRRLSRDIDQANLKILELTQNIYRRKEILKELAFDERWNILRNLKVEIEKKLKEDII